jgi:hypothetical protein
MIGNEHIRLSKEVSLSETELESLKHSLWEIDCPRVTVESCSSQTPWQFSGSGFVKQIANYQLTFKFYVQQEEQTPHEGYYRQAAIDDGIKLGEIIPETAYYDLTALDYQGRVWRSERILIKIDRCASGDFIVQGTILKIVCEGEIPEEIECKGSRLEIRVFDNIEIPCNDKTFISKSVAGGVQSRSISHNIWKFECCKLNFLLTREDSKLLTINVISEDEDASEHLGTRILEALQFILGYPINWTTSYQRRGRKITVTLCSPKQRSISSRFQPPLILGGYFMEEAQVFLHLFEKYLQHVIDYDQQLHPLWAQLNAIHEASYGTFIDAHALTLVVAIESLLLIEFKDVGNLTNEDKDCIREALKYIENWNGKEAIKKRIKGATNGLYQIRADDKMKILIELGAITNKQWEAWKKLRNTHVHEYQMNNLQHDRLRLIFQVNVLFYHLIFHAIGYRGVYMDVSVPGFPIKQYPPCEAVN